MTQWALKVLLVGTGQAASSQRCALLPDRWGGLSGPGGRRGRGITRVSGRHTWLYIKIVGTVNKHRCPVYNRPNPEATRCPWAAGGKAWSVPAKERARPRGHSLPSCTPQCQQGGTQKTAARTTRSYAARRHYLAVSVGGVVVTPRSSTGHLLILDLGPTGVARWWKLTVYLTLSL